jgi:protein gp37
MEKTLISYCDSTINPTANCVGCELWNPAQDVKSCYAGRMTERWQGAGAFDKPIKLIPGRMDQAAKWSDLRGVDRPTKPWLNDYPRIIFVGDMSDSLSPDVPFDYLLSELIRTVNSELGRRHIYLWLTKQAQRLLQFDLYLAAQGIDWPANLWPGVSLTSQSTLPRVKYLASVRARVRWISVEPLLSPLKVGLNKLDEYGRPLSHYIHWCVAGGESGPKAHATPADHFRNLRDECIESHVPFYFKQWGEHNQEGLRVGRNNTGEALDGREWRQMPAWSKYE